jgi:hypothetical protein
MIMGRKVHGELAINVGFAVIKLAALVYVIRLAGAVFPPETLGVFLLARRLASTVANLLQLGSSQTLLRYLPMAESAVARRRYVTVGCALWIGVASIALAGLVPARSIVAAWTLPGFADGPELAVWAAVLAMVTILEFVVCTSFLAERRLVPANALELMSVSGFLVLGLLWPMGALTPMSLLRFQTLGVLFMCVAVLFGRLWISRRRWSEPGATPTWTETTRAFITYGLPRGGITGLDVAIITIGPWLLRAQPAQAGYLLVALMIVQVIQAALGPITQIASIVAANFVGRGEMARLKEEVQLLLGGTLYAATLALAFLVPWSGYLLAFWLRDPELVAGVQYYFSWLAWGVLPIALFYALRGIIEMRWFAPWNLCTLLSAAAAQLLVYAFGRGLFGETAAVRAAVLTTFLALGGFTLGMLDTSWWRPLRYWGVGRLAGVGAAVALANRLLAEQPGPLEALLGVVLSAAIVLVGLVLWPSPPAILAVRTFLWPRSSLERQGRT